jgi:hypothetical protein
LEKKKKCSLQDAYEEEAKYKLSEYLKKHKLDYLSEVESKKDTLTLYGYNDGDNSTLLKIKVGSTANLMEFVF